MTVTKYYVGIFYMPLEMFTPEPVVKYEEGDALVPGGVYVGNGQVKAAFGVFKKWPQKVYAWLEFKSDSDVAQQALKHLLNSKEK